ncbi:MAG TPA: hypothetical protein VK850_02220 [Candidatus Binatia bacterium]|nr:hypothetical protein [Candidatus Binatia bacterium]
MIDMVKGRGANHDETHQKNSADQSETMPRQRAKGPNPRERCESEAEKRDDRDKNRLKDAAIFVPAGGFGEMLEHRREQSLEIKLFIDP